jgi:hypothetical protein
METSNYRERSLTRRGPVLQLESLTEWILTQMSQDLVQALKTFLFCGGETSRRQLVHRTLRAQQHYISDAWIIRR